MQSTCAFCNSICCGSATQAGWPPLDIIAIIMAIMFSIIVRMAISLGGGVLREALDSLHNKSMSFVVAGLNKALRTLHLWLSIHIGLEVPCE